jgi:hypothetical protein
MLKFYAIFYAIFLFSCSKQLKIVEKNQTIVTIENFPQKDTTIMIRDFFIKYRAEGPYIMGSVESPFTEGHGTFKSSKSVTIDISEGKLAIF